MWSNLIVKCVIYSMHWGPNVWLAKMRTSLIRKKGTLPNSAIQLHVGALRKEGKRKKYFCTAYKRDLDTQALFQTGSSAFRGGGEAEGRRTNGPIHEPVYGNASPFFHCFKRKKCAHISRRPKTKSSRLDYRNTAVSIQPLTDQSCRRTRIWSWHSQPGCPGLLCMAIAGHSVLGQNHIYCDRCGARCKYSSLRHLIS